MDFCAAVAVAIALGNGLWWVVARVGGCGGGDMEEHRTPSRSGSEVAAAGVCRAQERGC